MAQGGGSPPFGRKERPDYRGLSPLSESPEPLYKEKKGERNGGILVILHPLDLDWHRIVRGQEMTDERRDPITGDRDGRLIETEHYYSTSRKTQYRDRDGRMEYTGKWNGNEYQIRDRSGNLQWTEQDED